MHLWPLLLFNLRFIITTLFYRLFAADIRGRSRFTLALETLFRRWWLDNLIFNDKQLLLFLNGLNWSNNDNIIIFFIFIFTFEDVFDFTSVLVHLLIG